MRSLARRGRLDDIWLVVLAEVIAQRAECQKRHEDAKNEQGFRTGTRSLGCLLPLAFLEGGNVLGPQWSRLWR